MYKFLLFDIYEGKPFSQSLIKSKQKDLIYFEKNLPPALDDLRFKNHLVYFQSFEGVRLKATEKTGYRIDISTHGPVNKTDLSDPWIDNNETFYHIEQIDESLYLELSQEKFLKEISI